MVGTHQLFERLVAEHGSEVRRVCQSIARDGHLAADASQETFLRLWRRLEEGFRPARAGAWLQRVAVSVSIDLRRRGTRRETEPLDERAASEAPDPAAEHELEQRLRGALEKLPEGQRTVFVLRHEGGLSLSEVAAALGLALPTVKTQFARAVLRLQQALRAFDDHESRSHP